MASPRPSAGPRTGPSHPLVLIAVALLLLNDHLLKGAWPGVVTGKLSDVAWLIVAPVAVAALASLAGASDRVARAAGIGLAGAAFVALQLWPPLGDTWVAWVGGQHTPDPTDLLCLPALLLVPIAWRRARPFRWALPIASLALVATSKAVKGTGSSLDVEPCATVDLYWEVWRILDERYPHFDADGVDWEALGEACAPTRDREPVSPALECLIAPLNDTQIAIELYTGESLTTGFDYFKRNVDETLAFGRLDPGVTILEPYTSGTIGGSIGYLGIDSWHPDVLEDVDVAGLVDAVGPVDAMIVDMRFNEGGLADLGLVLAGRFVADATLAYAYDVRGAALHFDDNRHQGDPSLALTLPPELVAAEPFEGRVAVLTGGACKGACETFVAAMRIAPEVRTFGANTRGTNGVPIWQDLSVCGGRVRTSTRRFLLPPRMDDTYLVGIAPDEPVTFTGDTTDEVLDAALAWIVSP